MKKRSRVEAMDPCRVGTIVEGCDEVYNVKEVLTNVQQQQQRQRQGQGQGQGQGQKKSSRVKSNLSFAGMDILKELESSVFAVLNSN